MLINLLSAHAAAALAARDWAACAAALNAPTIAITDETPVTYSLIREHFGEDARKLVATTIRAAAAQDGDIADAHTLLLGGGIRVDLPERQAALTQLGSLGNWPAELTAGIKSLGRRVVSVAQHAGLPVVTTQQVADAVETVEAASRRQGLRDRADFEKTQFDARYNAALSQIASGTITTGQQLLAVLREV